MKKVPQVLKDKVIEEYLSDSFDSLPQLAQKHAINPLTLKSWIYTKDKDGNSLKDKKDALQEEIKKEAVKVSVTELSKTLKIGGQILSDILLKLQGMIERGEIWDPRDLVKVFGVISGSIKNMHGTIRLEDGKSTSNNLHHSTSSTSLDEVMEMLRNDPYAPKKEIDI